MAVNEKHLTALREITGDGGLRTHEDLDGLDPGIDAGNFRCGVLVRPSDIDELGKILAYCSSNHIGVVAHGGRTGLAMGAVSSDGEIAVETSRLASIVSLDPVAGTVIAEAGVTLERIEKAANEYDLSVGIDLGARGTATIGGMVSTNAGGIEAFRNGITRNRVTGLQAVLADGTVFNELKEVTKANEGIDVKQLFIGAEGTLGVVTQVCLNLVPIERNRMTALVSVGEPQDAVSLYRLLHNRRDGRLLSAEMMLPAYARQAAKELNSESVLAFEPDHDATFALFEIANENGDGESFLQSVLGEAVENGAIHNAVIAKNDRERDAMWRLREESFAAEASYPHQLWFDVSVPLGRIQHYLETVERDVAALDPALALFTIAHIGDGNIHTTVASMEPLESIENQVRDICYEPLVELNGSFSAEHGIGLEKRDYLARYACPNKLKLMQLIKASLDPNGIMNPGKIL